MNGEGTLQQGAGTVGENIFLGVNTGLPTNKRSTGDQVFEVLPQSRRDIATSKDHTQLQIADKGVIGEIGA